MQEILGKIKIFTRIIQTFNYINFTKNMENLPLWTGQNLCIHFSNYLGIQEEFSKNYLLIWLHFKKFHKFFTKAIRNFLKLHKFYPIWQYWYVMLPLFLFTLSKLVICFSVISCNNLMSHWICSCDTCLIGKFWYWQN